MKDPNENKSYTLKPVVKPVPKLSRTKTTPFPKYRDIAEDDDGYHPYADVPDNRPIFEEDPWR